MALSKSDTLRGLKLFKTKMKALVLEMIMKNDEEMKQYVINNYVAKSTLENYTTKEELNSAIENYATKGILDNYAKADGTNASGTWNINIKGNAAGADHLTNNVLTFPNGTKIWVA